MNKRRLPRWSARDWRAFIALWASIAGAAVLTGLSFWIVRWLSLAGEEPALALEALRALALSNYGLLAIIGAILLSLGLAINRRTIRLKAFGGSVEAEGGARHPDEPS